MINKAIKTLALVALTVATVKAVERVNKKFDNIQSQLNWKPGLRAIDRLDQRIDDLEKNL